MVHLFGPGRPIARSLALAAAFLTIACSSSTEKGKLRPEGPPEILEVFMFEAASDDPTADSALNLAYGCGDPRTLDCAPDQIAGLSENEQPRMRLCCDRQLYNADDDGVVSRALLGVGQKIRIILDELLRGNTVEQFVCACNAPPTGTDANCQNGPTASLDPLNCEDNPNTPLSEASRFADANLDGVPDKTNLLPGMVEVYCEGLTATWLNAADEGWYNPSGNQQVPANTQLSEVDSIVLEWDAVGPAVVIQPKGLPSNSTCHLRFREESMYPVKGGTGIEMVPVDTARDKDGNAVPEPEDRVTFNTDVMRLVTSTPQANASGVQTSIPNITVTFNTAISPQTLAAITVTAGGVDVTGTRTVSSTDPTTFQFVPDAPLGPSTTYTVTVTTTLTDLYGGTFPQTAGFSFTTGTM